jgi:hypothetical protein
LLDNVPAAAGEVCRHLSRGIARKRLSVLYRILADGVLAGHVAFILFVVFGGALVLRRPRLAWLHVPAVVWGALIEAAGWICPLTPLENSLRRAAGQEAYAGDFVGRYLLALIYPEGLTRELQMMLAVLVVAVNAVFYGVLILRLRRRNALPD